jgi:hypothetical protein
MARTNKVQSVRYTRRWGALACAGLLVASLVSNSIAQTNPTPVDPRLRQPILRPGNPAPAVPEATAQPKLRMPAFPQTFDVAGPEVDSFGFAVTQAGPIAIDLQTQGAPLIVTLKSPGGQATTQQGAGSIRLNGGATDEDVKRSPFWFVQIRLAQPMPPQQGGRAGGVLNVQSPPVDQAAVQRALQAMPAAKPEAAPSPQARAQATAQLDQAFQQRKAQLDQQQEQRRAMLFSVIQPQVDRLRALSPTNGTIRSRGLERASIGVARANAGMVMAAGSPPAFPQKFSVQGPQSDSFGFAVTQPGPVQVDVQTQGAPVVVTLQNLASAPISQRGSGSIRFTYQITAQDVQKSALWVVKVSLAEPAAPVSQASAAGTVMVQHPPGDLAVAQAQANAVAAQERATQDRNAAAAMAQSQAAFQQFKARLEQDRVQRQAAERAQNQPLIDQIRARAGNPIRSRGLSAPVIDRLNKTQGQPKDQVIVYGRNLGTGGEVVFQLGPNIAGTGIVEAWSDTVVVVDVPDASGLLQFDGSIAIKLGATQSNATPFRFIPLQEVREIHSTRGDISIAQPGTTHTGPNATYDQVDHDNTTFMMLGGSKGNDIFFPTSRLQNGWIVQDIRPSAQGCGTPFCVGVTVADHRIGTDVPFFNVRWWYDALANLKYGFSMWIVGPRGVPDGILVRGAAQPVVPPGTPAPQTPDQLVPPAQPIEMTVVPVNPSLLMPVYQVPASNPPSNASPGSATSAPPSSTSPASGSSGSGSSMTPPPASTTPVITSLSVPAARPGEPVMINGSNFGSGGEIHFVIAPGQDLVATPAAPWTDTQLFTSVPIVTGVTAFNGQVYVKRTSDQKLSNLAAFRFEPTLEMREIRGTLDRLLKPPYRPEDLGNASEIRHNRVQPDFVFGSKDNDELLVQARLKNGWVSDSAYVTCEQDQYIRCDGGAYVWDLKAGSDWPYLNVRWWLNPDGLFSFSHVWYQFGVRIVGPKGVPDGVVVP